MSAGENRLASALERALKPPWAIYRNVAWLEKRPGDEPADGEADKGQAHRIKDPFAQVTREMHGLRRKCEELPAWLAHRVRFARAVCLPDSAYDRSMTPDGPREIVIDHDDLADAGARVQAIFDWWSRSGGAAADGGAPGELGMKALHALLGRDLVIESPLAAGVAAAEDRIITLTERQFGILDTLHGHRRALILGVARP